VYLPFGQARDVARGLGIRTKAEWIAWCVSDAYPARIPMQPWEFYQSEWRGWPDWLGFTIETRLPFAQARAFARELGFHSPTEWYQWCKNGKRPRIIPRDPRSAYPGDFIGFPDWLGYTPRDCRGRMMPFAVACEYARRLALRSAKEWYAWAASEKRVRTIACNPQETYASQWAGWRDWLGHERQEMLPFRVARKQVRHLGLRSRSEWIAWTKSAERPRNIPCKPEDTYAFYWRGIPDWLGYKPVKWLQFYRARWQAHQLGLRSCAEWWAWVKTDQRPRNMPSAPQNVYRPYWNGWGDWLGYGPRTKAPLVP